LTQSFEDRTAPPEDMADDDFDLYGEDDGFQTVVVEEQDQDVEGAEVKVRCMHKYIYMR